MNLRMTPNALRFRLNGEELAQLLKGQSISERLSFHPDHTLVYQVSLANPEDTTDLSRALLLNTSHSSTGETVLNLQVMPAIAQAYADSDDQRQGVEDLHTQSNAEDLLIALEVDVGRR